MHAGMGEKTKEVGRVASNSGDRTRTSTIEAKPLMAILMVVVVKINSISLTSRPGGRAMESRASFGASSKSYPIGAIGKEEPFGVANILAWPGEWPATYVELHKTATSLTAPTAQKKNNRVI